MTSLTSDARSTIGSPNNAAESRPVAAISAPILDEHGHAALLLSVHPLVELSPERIDTIGRRLVETATAISAGPPASRVRR
ncbi:hypothetical protein [Nocardia macrotermitis]|uniref:IclR-ED domain-containing protein n=1 Tax=Nocardia macrotermitis TaxID=2585198 RepID=A0A7K0D4E4_9NOCA|nr:hypothetical protein [Nocardia macrotermitis]MQY20623.1 hypothetical protein [Nocardia macrotermitis]